MDLEPILRRLRKELVVAAKAAVDRGGNPPNKSQLSRLVSVCGEATCTEEIENYLRYQCSRDSRPWDPGVVEAVIAGIRAGLQSLDTATPAVVEVDRDRLRAAAWRTYAVFLAREYTYARYTRPKEWRR